MKYGLVVFAALTLATAACNERSEHLSADFGNAVNSNIAAQVDNPLPNERVGAGPQDGVRLEKAMERYRTNKVYHPHLPLEGGHVYDQQQQMQQQ
jgi:type IV pilus biogenesis protein CpaD/CtpE